jgi:integrase/recombinase XerD
MSFFDSFYRMELFRHRHNAAPLCRKRGEFLGALREQGYSENTLRQFSSYLLHVNRILGFKEKVLVITPEELRWAGKRWAKYSGPHRNRLPGKYAYELFMRIARVWLRYNNCLAGPIKSRVAEDRLRDFEERLSERFGLAAATVQTRTMHASFFLNWLAERRVPLRYVTLQHVERYLDFKRDGGWALATQSLAAYCLRMFLRHAEERQWVTPGLYQAVPTFKKSKYAFIPKGPSWDGVRRIIASLRGKTNLEIRDRAIVLLIAVYGLRYGEIRDLRLTDVDLERPILTVRRGKNYRAQRYPLNQKTVFSLRRYICEGRPTCESPALFVTSLSPHRPLSHGTVYAICKRLFSQNNVESPRKGPHALRHACAMQMMKTDLSLREIAIFLGHRDIGSVAQYARYDMNALRKVANFSLSGLI